jgi:tetratricopeptide (TPR) repeat protein
LEGFVKIWRFSVLALALAVAGGSPLAAQARNQRLAQAQGNKFVPPLCNLSLGNKKVEQGRNALRKAYEAKTPADRATQLGDAKANLETAISAEAQGSNAAAWYFLARVALLEGDPAGADSAFTKAEALAPSCELDITQYRQNNWATLGTAGIEMQRQGQNDSALVMFRDANYLFRGLPHVYTNMGVMFANMDRDDSAAVYFAKSLEIAEKDTALVEDRNSVALNLAIVLQRVNRHRDAVAVLHKLIAWKPGDLDAQKSLAIAFRGAGMTDSAEVIENRMVSTFSAMNPDSLDTRDLMSVGIAAFNKYDYPQALDAFERIVKRNPWGRDAIFNVANTHLAMATKAADSADALRKAARATRTPSEALRAQLADTVKFDAEARAANQKLVQEAQRLLELEPLNEDAVRLLAQGQRSLGDSAVLKTAERLVRLPFSLEVTMFQIGQTGARFAAQATGRAAQDAQGRPIAPAPLTVTVEFVNASGTVVDSKEFTIPALAKDQKHELQAEASGAGIAGWRYKQK